MKKPEKIYAFIDSQNLNLAILDQGWKLDFDRFRKYLRDKYSVTKAILFLGYVSKNKKLYAYLQHIGYTLVFKPVVEIPGKEVKGNIDAELVLHAAAIEFTHYDKAIVITGDGDFYCLLRYLKEQEKLLHLMVPNRKKYSSLLRTFIQSTIFLNEMKGKLQQ